MASLEAASAGTRGRPRPANHGWPLSAGDEQVEQDRAPTLLVPQPNLERAAAAPLSDHRESDWRHHYQSGLRVKAVLDTHEYAVGVKVTKAPMEALVSVTPRLILTGTTPCIPGWSSTLFLDLLRLLFRLP
jgi:hypothetical protein